MLPTLAHQLTMRDKAMNREDASCLMRVHEVLKPWVSKQPNALAIKDARHALTYAELDRQSDLMCERLREHGVRPGDRVLLVSENCAVLGVAFLALSKLGAWASVVNARLSEREIRL